ncbi:glycoside hydrolase family 2 protein [Paraconexibacter sp.]|uniref:glycoside hydrolase family 2 protein n=1 Tax=Paraconexibacter sp. TaxID=2949640 RepID=UPI00356AF7B5
MVPATMRRRRGILGAAALALLVGVGVPVAGQAQNDDAVITPVKPANLAKVSPGAGSVRARTAASSGLVPSVIHGGATGRMALAGPWRVQTDRYDHGRLKGYQAGAFEGSRAMLPFSPNAKTLTGKAGAESFRGTVAWYRTTFSVPTGGDYRLRFESVNHRATVYLDGRKLGTHLGEYLPFEYLVGLEEGVQHELVVKADWRGPLRMKKAGWHRTWFNFGGINREVSVRPVGTAELTAPTIQTRLQPDGSAKVDVTIHARNRINARSLPVSGVLRRGDERYPLSFPDIVVARGDTRVLYAQVTVPKPALWAPGSPNLYDLEIGIPGEAGYVEKVGLREITRRGSDLLLNGQRIVLRGASIHEDAKGRGDAVTAADMDGLVKDLVSIGANATRAQHPLHPALLERLDAAGILLWMGIGPVDAPGAWTSRGSKLQAQARRRVRTTFFQTQTHPSLIAWNLVNEIAGNGHPAGQIPYIRTMSAELKRRDPGRLVALDVWGAHPPKKAGAVYRNIDAIGDTNYIGWYEKTKARRSTVRKAIRDHIGLLRRVFPDKILAVTEFGAEANRLNPTNKPGGFRFQADLLKLHLDVYSSIPKLSGMLVWNLRDFAVAPSFAGGSIRKQVPEIKIVKGINQKGLFEYSGRRKPSADVVKAAFARAAG